MPSPLRLKISNDLLKKISNFHPGLKKKIRFGLDCLCKNPSEGKALRAELSGLWSLRIGRFRIIYQISEKVLEIVAVGPRKNIYEETKALQSKK